MQTKKPKQRKLPAHEFRSKSSGLGLKIHKRSRSSFERYEFPNPILARFVERKFVKPEAFGYGPILDLDWTQLGIVSATEYCFHLKYLHCPLRVQSVSSADESLLMSICGIQICLFLVIVGTLTCLYLCATFNLKKDK